MNEVSRRNKYTLFFFLWLSILVPPYLLCMLGTGLPDFMCVLNTDLKAIGSLFFTYDVGKIVVPIYMGVVQDSVDVTLLCSLSLVVIGVIVPLLSFTTSLVVANIIWFTLGLCSGAVSVARFVIVNALVPKANFVHHVMSSASPLSCLITPPFVSLFVNNHHTQRSSTITANKTGCSTNIEFAFLTVSIFVIIVASGFICNYHSILNSGMTLEHGCVVENSFDPAPRSALRSCLYVILMTLFATITACITMFYSLMTTYGLRSDLHLDVKTSAAITSLFSGCQLVTRVVCSCIAERVKPSCMLWFSLCLLLASNGVFLYVKDTNATALWIITAVRGVGTAPIFVSLFTLSKQYLKISTRLVCIMLCVDEIGNIIVPMLSTILIDIYGPDMFIYLGVAVRVFQTLLLMSFTILAALVPKS